MNAAAGVTIAVLFAFSPVSGVSAGAELGSGTAAPWQVLVLRSGEGHYFAPNPGCFSLEFLETHILPFDQHFSRLGEQTPLLTMETETTEVGQTEGTSIYYLLHHVNDRNFSLVKDVVAEVDEGCFAPVAYLAANPVELALRQPFIVEVSDRRVLSSCDVWSGTGRFYARFDWLLEGGDLHPITVSDRFTELVDENRSEGEEHCTPLLFIDGEGRDCKGVNLETMT